jgi:hypothetical protein
MHRADARADSCPSPARGTVLRWCGNQIGKGTSRQRSCPTVAVASGGVPRSRSRGLQEAPGHRGPAARPWRRVAPGGSLARDAHARSGDDACGLWRVAWRLACVETWGTPMLREGLCWVKSASADVTHPPLVSVKTAPPLRHTLPGRRLSSITDIRYIYAQATVPMPAPFSARGIGLGRVGDDL